MPSIFQKALQKIVDALAEEDIQFLLTSDDLDMPYIKHWAKNLKLDTHGLLG